jgi:hypothetical protein
MQSFFKIYITTKKKYIEITYLCFKLIRRGKTSIEYQSILIYSNSKHSFPIDRWLHKFDDSSRTKSTERRK